MYYEIKNVKQWISYKKKLMSFFFSERDIDKEETYILIQKALMRNFVLISKLRPLPIEESNYLYVDTI